MGCHKLTMRVQRSIFLDLDIHHPATGLAEQIYQCQHIPKTRKVFSAKGDTQTAGRQHRENPNAKRRESCHVNY
jgi:hypothetical protein